MKKRWNDRLRERAGGESGFTLIELLVVMLIIGILLAIAIPTFLSVIGNAHNTAAESNLGNAVIEANADYTSDGGGFGNSTKGLTDEMISGETSFTYTGGTGTVTGLTVVGVSGAQCGVDTSTTATDGTGTTGQNCQAVLLDAWSPGTGVCYYVMIVKGNIPSGGFTEQGATVSAQGTYYGANLNMSSGCSVSDALNAKSWNQNGFPAPS